MIQVNSGGANGASARTIRPLLAHQIRMAAAILMFAGLMFAGCLKVIPSAFAQTSQETQAECTAKCDADEKKCLDAQSSEELCDYDKKMCKKACGQQ
jgi:hypothetical protein